MTVDDSTADMPEARQQESAAGQPTIMIRPQAAEPRRPLYRVVEVVRAVAGNTSGHRVMVVDGAGAILEELNVVPQDRRSGTWEGWKEAQLPPLPAKRGKLRARPPAPFAKPRPAASPAWAALPAPVPAAATPDLALDVPEQVEATDTQPAELRDELPPPRP